MVRRMSGVQFTPAAPTRASGLIGKWQTLTVQTRCPLAVRVRPRVPVEFTNRRQSVAAQRQDGRGPAYVQPLGPPRSCVAFGGIAKSERNSQARSSEAERPFYTGRVGISKFPAPTISRVVSSAGEHCGDNADVRCSTHRRRTTSRTRSSAE